MMKLKDMKAGTFKGMSALDKKATTTTKLDFALLSFFCRPNSGVLSRCKMLHVVLNSRLGGTPTGDSHSRRFWHGSSW